MRLTALARRYAAALFGAARSMDAIDKAESDLGLLTHVVQTMPRLQETLAHPLIPPARKKNIAAQVFRAEVEEVTLSFLNLLIDKRREEILPEVEREYVRLANDYRGVVPATATSAVTLTADEQRALREKLEQFTGKTIELELAEDPSLIGGLVVRIGDTVIDGSVTGYLQGLRGKLLGLDG